MNCPTTQVKSHLNAPYYGSLISSSPNMSMPQRVVKYVRVRIAYKDAYHLSHNPIYPIKLVSVNGSFVYLKAPFESNPLERNPPAAYVKNIHVNSISG